MARNNTIGNNGPHNILPFAANLFFGVNQNELIANGPPFNGLTWYNPCELSDFSPSGVPSGGFGGQQTDDGRNSTDVNLSAAGATIGWDGFQDGCVNYDGVTGYSDLLSFDSGFTNFSIAAWIKVPNFTNLFVITILGNNAVQNYLGFYVGGAADFNGSLIGDTAGAGHNMYTTELVPTNQPVHVAISVPGNSSGILFYINGKQCTTNAQGTTNSVAADGTGSFHAVDYISSGPTVYGAGSLYKWQFYWNILSSGDVLDLYAAGLAHRRSWWTMWNEMPVLPGVASPGVERRTLSPVGTRTGSRQVQGGM